MKKLKDIIERLKQVQEQSSVVRKELERKIDGKTVKEMKKEEKNIKVEIWNEKTIGGETASLETFLIKQSDGNAIRVLTATLWPVSIELKICDFGDR